MQKILVALNAVEININTIDFACFIARLSRSKLTGIFLEMEREKVPALKRIYGSAYLETIVTTDFPESSAHADKLDQNIRFFKEACESRGVTALIHKESGIPADEIIQESRFADLLIVDANVSFHQRVEGPPTAFVKEVLTRSECPVLIAPYSFYGIDEIVFAYDGSASSAFAIRQFICLFPKLADKSVTMLYADDNKEELVIDNHQIRELLQMHFNSTRFELLRGRADDELFGYLLRKKRAFIVMGAFGRSMLSSYLRHSTAELLIKTVDAPLFIAHHKI